LGNKTLLLGKVEQNSTFRKSRTKLYKKFLLKVVMIVGYTGIGAKKNGIHTEQEFLDIMNKEFTHKDWNTSWPAQLQFKDWVLPDEFIFFTLKNWIEYAGAGIYNTLEEAEKDME
jgi:hypothetical protein